MDYLDNIIILENTGANPGDFIVSPDGNSESAQQQTQSAETAAVQGEAANQSQGGILQSPIAMILFYVVVIGGVLFYSSRSQRKKEKAVRDLQDAVKVGDEVHTSGGLFGKVVEKYDDKLIIEFGTNKGVRIPVRRSDVYPVKADTDTTSK
ncbi:MAG: preprotein translocase subunit YajC [Clostridiales bacterium]|jgi:preprotein translocase subunit YajC|nr:preprotein translocase subunit YajC [Clostridiales bacterium]